MAKQESIVQFTGTLGGINFYFRKGVPVARKAGGGFNGKAIKKSPKMVRVRENNSEFGTSSRLKKVFSDCLKLYFGKRRDVTLHGRLMRLFLDIKDCDLLSERGKRSVGLGLQTDVGKKLLTSFEITAMPFPVLEMVYTSSSYTLVISKLFKSTKTRPKGATHLELCLGVVVMDFEAKNAILFKSAVVLVPQGVYDVALTLVPNELPVGVGVQIPVLFFAYVQEVNGVVYPLKDADCFGMRVLEV